MGYENAAAAAEDHLVTVPLHLWSSSFFFRRGNELDSPPLGFSHSVWIGNIKLMLDESFIYFFSFIAFGLEKVLSRVRRKRLHPLTILSRVIISSGTFNFRIHIPSSYSYFVTLLILNKRG